MVSSPCRTRRLPISVASQSFRKKLPGGTSHGSWGVPGRTVGAPRRSQAWHGPARSGTQSFTVTGYVRSVPVFSEHRTLFIPAGRHSASSDIAKETLHSLLTRTGPEGSCITES